MGVHGGGSIWASGVEACVGVTEHVRGCFIGGSLAARDIRILCPAHAETTNIVPTAGPMRVRGCVPTRAARGYRKGTRPVPPTAPVPPAPPRSADGWPALAAASRPPG